MNYFKIVYVVSIFSIFALAQDDGPDFWGQYWQGWTNHHYNKLGEFMFCNFEANNMFIIFSSLSNVWK